MAAFFCFWRTTSSHPDWKPLGQMSGFSSLEIRTSGTVNAYAEILQKFRILSSQTRHSSSSGLFHFSSLLLFPQAPVAFLFAYLLILSRSTAGFSLLCFSTSWDFYPIFACSTEILISFFPQGLYEVLLLIAESFPSHNLDCKHSDNSDP